MTEDTKFILATDIAVIALILSGLSLYLQWRQRKPHLVVTATIRSVFLPSMSATQSGLQGRDIPCLVIHVANPSDKAVHADLVHLATNSGKKVEVGNYNAMYGELMQPFSIEPWGGHDVFARGQTILNKLAAAKVQLPARVSAIVTDELGRTYRSKRFLVASDDLKEPSPEGDESAA